MQNEKLKTSVGIKMLMIGFLILLLLIPTFWITTIIWEREERRIEVLSEITSKWGGDQAIAGPVLVIPVDYINKDDKGKEYAFTQYIYLLPEALDISGNIEPEIRYRGIYHIPLYKSDLQMAGKFDLENIKELDLKNGRIRYNKAHLELGVQDLKGIINNIKIEWNKQKFAARTGLKSASSISNGLHFLVPVDSKNKEYKFSMNINLNGSEKIQFAPIGKDTKVKISSDWPHPSFCGDFLPQQKSISEKGFEAQWQIFSLNRSFAHLSFGKPIQIEDNFFGVKLFYPVDQYQQTTRAVKYAILFLGLTFLCYFLIEILSKKFIHPMQYLLIGSGLVLFYLLLLSLSEHIVFSLAYLIASIAIIALIAFYTKAALKQFKFVSIVVIVLSILYLFLYINLQLQDYALLFGTAGLFLALTAVMFFTRNIDWFNVLKQTND